MFKMLTKYNLFLESLKTDMWDVIPQSIKDLHTLFQSKGKKLYLVGGSVRDFLKKDKPKDFDLATDALPDEVLQIVGKHYRTNLQGKAFGVVVVYTDDQPEGMEIATFREDISKGRNPEVKLGVTIEQDVLRRDLTYNALFYDLDKREIVDLVGGIKDLESGITRMVGNAIERFDEDSLRILRAFRFAARYGHPLDKTTAEAIHKRGRLENIDPETGEMKRISQERIWEEFKKAWKQAKDFRFYLSFFSEFNMWEEAFPGITELNINTNFSDSKDLIVVLATLLQGSRRDQVNELLDKMVYEWKIENEIATKVVFLLNFNRLTIENAVDLYKQKERCHITNETLIEWIRKNNLSNKMFYGRYDAFMKYKPSINAQELMAKGIKGKALGEEIKRLETEEFKKLL